MNRPAPIINVRGGFSRKLFLLGALSVNKHIIIYISVLSKQYGKTGKKRDIYPQYRFCKVRFLYLYNNIANSSHQTAIN